MMKISVRFFATYRQLTGVDRFDLESDNTMTVADIIKRLEQCYPQLLGKLNRGALIAINEQYAHREQKLQPNDTVAFFPPVSGG
jgi:molybdopterin synthase sulfur carrier subunit